MKKQDERKIVKCPRCGERLAEYAYGLLTKEGREEVEKDKYLIMGGCCVGPERYYCRNCQRGFDKDLKNPFDDDKMTWFHMCSLASDAYHPKNISPFVQAHGAVAVVQSDVTGRYYTGFSIEGECGAMNLCAERVAVLKMYMEEKNVVVRRMVVFHDDPPFGRTMPCGACREFLMQLSYENRYMELQDSQDLRETIMLKDLMPDWWGDKRYERTKKQNKSL